MNYKILDLKTYYRSGMFRRFSDIAKCSVSITSRIDVTELYCYSKQTGTKFYLNFLFLLTQVLNSRDDYKTGYLYESDELVVYDKVNPTHYVFFDDIEICTPVYSEYFTDYRRFYEGCRRDIELAEQKHVFAFDGKNHPNWFDASYIPWLSYDALHVELPDGYLYFMPIINWGKFSENAGRLQMPVSVRMNHAVADGYLISKVFILLEEAIKKFVSK